MGQCLLESLLKSRYIFGHNAQSLRMNLLIYILENKSVFREQLQTWYKEEPIAYCKRMARPEEDGDHALLAAAALLFNVQVVIHFWPDGKTFIENSSAQRAVHIRWIPGHYSFLHDA